MVIYSGAKAFNAPTSGFITGKKQWIAACKAQHHGIARARKIGKENMVGLVYALEHYHPGQKVGPAEELLPVAKAISAINGLQADIEQDEAGRAIWRIRIQGMPRRWAWMPAKSKHSCAMAISPFTPGAITSIRGFLVWTHERWLKGRWP